MSDLGAQRAVLRLVTSSQEIVQQQLADASDAEEDRTAEDFEHAYRLVGTIPLSPPSFDDTMPSPQTLDAGIYEPCSACQATRRLCPTPEACRMPQGTRAPVYQPGVALVIGFVALIAAVVAGAMLVRKYLA